MYYYNNLSFFFKKIELILQNEVFVTNELLFKCELSKLQIDFNKKATYFLKKYFIKFTVFFIKKIE